MTDFAKFGRSEQLHAVFEGVREYAPAQEVY